MCNDVYDLHGVKTYTAIMVLFCTTAPASGQQFIVYFNQLLLTLDLSTNAVDSLLLTLPLQESLQEETQIRSVFSGL